MQTNNIQILHGLNIIMVHKIPIVVVGNGLTAEVMCSALSFFGLEYTRLLSQRHDFFDTRTTTINIASQKMLSRLNLWSFSNENITSAAIYRKITRLSMMRLESQSGDELQL